jgi:hypothetical protein
MVDAARKEAVHMPPGKTEDAELGKIRSDFLRQETANARAEPHTVVVELNLPHPKVEFSRSSMGIGSAKQRIARGVDDSPEETKRHVAMAQKSIEKIIGHKADAFFPSSSAFVVTATGEQLRELANLDLVSAIWPNERG